MGIMIALVIPDELASRLALPNGEAANELHITLCYLDELENWEQFKRSVEQWAKYQVPVSGKINGIGRFSNVSDEGFQAFYASPDVPFLPQMRQSLVDMLRWDCQIEYSTDHGFIPHITLKYLLPQEPMPMQSIQEYPLSLNQLRVSVDRVVNFEIMLTGEMSLVSTGIKAGARHSSSDNRAIQLIHDNACELGATCKVSSIVTEAANNGTGKSLEDDLVEAGADMDGVIEIYVHKEDAEKYYVNFGDWAEDETVEAVKEVLGDIESEAEAPPPKKEEWRLVWPKKKGKAAKTVKVRMLPLASREMAWDAAAAEKRVRDWAEKDDSIDWAKYSQAFMYSDPEKKEELSGYKLQYADIQEGKLKAIPRAIFAIAGGRGVRAADIPESDKQKVMGAVNRYYAKMRKEFKDDSLTSPFEEKKTIEPNHLKYIGEDENELICGSYIVVFGGRDLEGVASNRVNTDGSRGEFFTKATVLESDYTALGQLPIDWEHGQDELDKDTVLGYVDWKSAQWDDKGVFVQRVLNRRHKYVKWLEELIKQGLIGNSTEPVQKGIKKKDNGEITHWPLKRDTLTVSPMEPRMMTENTIQVLKNLGVDILDENLEREKTLTRLRLKQKMGAATLWTN